MTRKREHRPQAEAHRARRDRGRTKDTWDLRGTVSWPTMAEGRPWTADVTSVRHVDDWMDRVGTMRAPELIDGAWTTLVEWTDPEPVSVRVVLDNLRPA